MNGKLKDKLLSAMLLFIIVLLAIPINTFSFGGKLYSCNLASPDSAHSNVYVVNVTITYNNVTEKILFADHTSSLEDGNWIKLAGGTTVKIPELTLSYSGVSSATYMREGRTIRIDSHFSSKEVTYPLTQHQVYREGDTINLTFYGSESLAGEKVDIRLIKASPLQLRDAAAKAFKGDISDLKSLVDNPVWNETDVELNSTGDYTTTLEAPDPGDYILAVVKETTDTNSYELRIYSATIVEVLDYGIDVDVPSTVTRGNIANVKVNIDAPESATGYRYGALIIHEDAYNLQMNLLTDGTVPGTNLTTNGATLLNGTVDTRTFVIAGVGLNNIDAETISNIIKKAVEANRMSVSYTEITEKNGTTVSLMTDSSMPTGKYILLVAVWELQTGNRIVAFYQGSLTLERPYVPPAPPPTPEEIEAMPAEEAAEEIEELPADKAAEILGKISTEKAAAILELTGTKKAADIVEKLPAEKAVNITMMVKLEKAADILEEVAIEKAKDIVETAVSFNLTDKVANITLAMNRTAAASVIVEVNATLAATLMEKMVEVNVTGTAEIVEHAAKKNIEKTIPILEEMDTESLVLILVEIARLPSSPETAAAILETMSLDKAVETVKLIIEMNALEELGKIFHYLSTERLNDIYGALTLEERVKLLPHLTSETVARIQPQLLPYPDLRPLSIVVIVVTPPEPVAEETCKVKVTVKNIGMVDAGRFDATLYADNIEIQTLPVESLAVNETATLIFSWTPTEPGTYTLKVIVDPENLVDELNETNNEISVSVSVKMKLLPDLTVEFTDLPEKFIAGTEYEVKALVKNVGEAEAGSFNVELKANESSIEKVPVEGLAAGSSITVTFKWKPEEVGTYTLKATVDPENLIEEKDETNNAATVAVTVSAPVPWYVQWWPLIAIIIIIIVALAAYMVIRKRAK